MREGLPIVVVEASLPERESAPDVFPPLEYGPHLRPDGVEFRLFSRNATAVRLLLYAEPTGDPQREILLDRQGDVWRTFVPGLAPGQLYAYRVEGPSLPERGHRFDPACVLLDPYALSTTANEAATLGDKSAYQSHPTKRPRCAVVVDSFDWQGVAPPKTHPADAIIYEVHLRGFTAHPESGVAQPGSYLGFLDKLDHLKQLGVTAVEFLPIHEFDHRESNRRHPLTGAPLVNYWGYSTIGFFAPNARYAAKAERAAQVNEFRTLVRELHRAGIEVILDVVYNHTVEGNHIGPILSFKGIENSIYYHLADDRRFFKDFSGCGNSVNCNHPVVRRLIVDSLRYWVTRMGVDGFRFDLASVLCRDRFGNLVAHAPLVEEIAEDPVLRDTKIIAEAWDAAGAYQVGSFPGGRWAEWNGRYRDDIRQYWRGDPGKTGALATRLMGSSDLYQPSGRRPWHSVNFVTCHDGFTLADLVAYNAKSNRENGEDNRDGENNNNSFNYGVEGPSDNPRIDSLRLRQMKNMLATLLVSQGVPMLLGGDEFRRTQRGNNNAYCQDNEISWFDWRLVEINANLLRFTRLLIAFRRQHPVFRRRNFFSGRRAEGRKLADVNWFRPDGRPKDWQEDDGTLVCLLDGAPTPGTDEPADGEVLLLFNASTRTVYYRLVALDAPERPWQLFFDTGNRSPRDLYPDGRGPKILPNSRYPLIERSLACFYR